MDLQRRVFWRLVAYQEIKPIVRNSDPTVCEHLLLVEEGDSHVVLVSKTRSRISQGDSSLKGKF